MSPRLVGGLAPGCPKRVAEGSDDFWIILVGCEQPRDSVSVVGSDDEAATCSQSVDEPPEAIGLKALGSSAIDVVRRSLMNVQQIIEPTVPDQNITFGWDGTRCIFKWKAQNIRPRRVT